MDTYLYSIAAEILPSEFYYRRFTCDRRHEQVGFEEAADLALGLATIGVMSGVIIGVILINWGVRTKKTELLKHPEEISD
jgi:Na+/glutamate symporter